VKQELNEEIVECPCYRICTGLGIETGQWCRYRKSALPPPGMHRFDPKETWCPPGVQANLLMLAYMLARGREDTGKLQTALEEVRRWARELRGEPAGYHPTGSQGN